MTVPDTFAAVRPKLLSLATAVPEHAYSQDLVRMEARRVFGAVRDDFNRLEPMFANSGILTRYSVRPLAWFLTPHDWPQRMQAYVEGATALYRKAAAAALAEAGLEPDEVDTLITVSSTGIATPTIEARVLFELGFRHDVKRVPVFGLGCAGGVGGLSLAARLSAAAPEERVLVVALELCTLSFRLDETTTKSIISAVLFGDGAAAAIVSCRGEGRAVISHLGEHTWPATLDLMGWTIDPLGFGVVLSSEIPAFVRREVRPAAEVMLERHGISLSDLSCPVFHPGGAKVLDALEEAFELEAGALTRERAVLRDYGNMSSPTVLFVLRRALDEGIRGRGMMSALGPGFSASFLVFEA